jgi:branched-subunit amino acid aminotransferase/4-amino-4-deoxychorismate lyase
VSRGCVFIDGEFVAPEDARISIFDPGFTRGDAVYDTVSVWKGSFFRLDDHVERFFASCRRARLAPPYDAGEVKALLAECVDRGGLEDAYVQAVSTRGSYPDPTVRDPRTCRNSFIGLAIPYVWIISPERQDEGLDLAIAGDVRRTPPEAIDPRMKNFNWLDLQRGLFEALDRSCDTAVLLTPSGLLAEGPGFNLFTVRGGRILTPRANVLEGITRRTVLELAAEVGAPVEEADLRPDDLRGADEAFLSSTAGGVMPVARVDGVPLRADGGPGPLSRRLRELYWSKREAGWYATPVADLLPAARAAQPSQG